MSPSEQALIVYRDVLPRALEALTHHATHMEYDCPGDAPEPCGQWCNICNQHIDDDDHTDGHASDCIINILRLIVHPAKNAGGTP